MPVPAELPCAPLPDGLVAAGCYSTYADAFQHSVVVLAMGEACWLVEDGPVHRLLVEAHALSGVREQLARFDQESVGWPPAAKADVAALPRADFLSPLLWCVIVLAVFQLQRARPAWVDMGLLSPDAMFQQGEWWRAFTALFLHGSASHVLSNALGGLLVFTALVSTFGRLRGWLLLGFSGVAGNFVIAALNQGNAYRSLGASTAIFAALGLLTGRAVRVACGAGPRVRWRGMFVSAATGLAVLGLYGAGGPNVDVPAHLAGFIAGLIMALLVPAARAQVR